MPISSSNLVEPSMSLKTRVTVPEGWDTAVIALNLVSAR